MVDKLQADYRAAGKQVLFLEQNYQQLGGGNWLGNKTRLNRYLIAAGSASAGYPYVDLDSGYRYTGGNKTNFYTAYKTLVDAELTRAPQGIISATYRRVYNHLEFVVKVTNQSGVTLSSTANGATVFVIVYQELTTPSRSVTRRIDRAVVYLGMGTPLANGATASYSLKTADLSGVTWSRLRMVAFVDYRPGKTTGAYRMIQAAMATGPVLTSQAGEGVAAENFAAPTVSEEPSEEGCYLQEQP